MQDPDHDVEAQGIIMSENHTLHDGLQALYLQSLSTSMQGYAPLARTITLPKGHGCDRIG